MAAENKPRLEVVSKTEGTPQAEDSKREHHVRAKECRLARRSAVDNEILMLLGNLAKKNPEGFVFASPAYIARTIKRTRYYVSQRIMFLEFEGRIIPTARIRRGREVRGWIVLRRSDWLQRQSAGATEVDEGTHGSTENNLVQSEKELARNANNLALSHAPKRSNCKENQRDARNETAANRGLLNERVDISHKSLSQSTKAGTATRPVEGMKSDLNNRLTREKALYNSLIRVAQKNRAMFRVEVEEKGGIDRVHYWNAAKAAFDCVGYEYRLDDDTFTVNFVIATAETFKTQGRRLQDGEIKPSSFCSKVIDEQQRHWGGVWPPSFTRHRDALRDEGR